MKRGSNVKVTKSVATTSKKAKNGGKSGENTEKSEKIGTVTSVCTNPGASGGGVGTGQAGPGPGGPKSKSVVSSKSVSVHGSKKKVASDVKSSSSAVKRKNDQSTLGSASVSDEVVKAKKVKNQDNKTKEGQKLLDKDKTANKKPTKSKTKKTVSIGGKNSGSGSGPGAKMTPKNSAVANLN